MTFKKKYRIRDEERERQLMIMISTAEDMERINREFNEFHDRTSAPLYGGLRKEFVPPTNNIQFVDEGYSDGWMKLVVHRRRYSPEYKAYNWAFTIFKNSTLNWLSKERNYEKRFSTIGYLEQKEKRRGSEVHLLSEGSSIVPREEPIVYTIMQSQTLDQLLKDAVRVLLTDREREIFIKRAFEEKKLDQIRKEMNISIGTAKSDYDKAVTKIQKFLKDNNFGWEEYVRSIS